jgi:putative ABC transport system permease protein
VPALLAGPVPDALDAAPELTATFFSYYSLPVQVVGRAEAFPGQASRVPLLVVPWDAAGTALQAADRDPLQVFDRQVWAPGEPAPLLAALTAAGYAYDDGGITTAGAFAAQPEVQAQTWSLAYLRAVALAAGLLGLLGIAMHALAQHRRRTVAALLLARMGLPRGSARTATALELGLLTGLGAAVAAAVALPVSALVVRLLDPAPTLLPGALVVVPWSSVAAVLGGLLVVTAGATLLATRSARTAPAGEVLRDAP